LDLNGKLVASACEKEASHERITELVSGAGTPSIIATDVSPAPSFVQKVAARFNARLFVPEHSLSQEEKRGIGGKIQNAHIRDAYAAAVKAYRNYENRLRQIEHMETSLDRDLLKHMVLQGHSLHNAELMLTRKEEKKMEEVERSEKKPGKAARDERLVRLAEENVNLRKALEMERAKAAELEERLKKAESGSFSEIAKDREVRRLTDALKRKSRYIHFLKKKKRRKKE